MYWLGTLLKQAGRILAMALAGGLLAATMVRMSPGFATDEQDLSLGLNQESRNALHAGRMADSNIALFYLHYLGGLLRGDFGYSRSLNRPVSQLLKERLPETLKSVSCGMAGGVILGLFLALATVFGGKRAGHILAGVSSSLFLSVPAAVLALVFLWLGADGTWAIALLVFPHVYRYSKNLLVESMESPHVLAARARGVSRMRVLLAHVAAPVAPQLLALAGVSVSIAFGAAIPVEVICDVPGIGQLAWKAALGRDLPLLVTITMLVALMTMTVNAAADLLIASWTSPSPRREEGAFI